MRHLRKTLLLLLLLALLLIPSLMVYAGHASLQGA